MRIYSTMGIDCRIRRPKWWHHRLLKNGSVITQSGADRVKFNRVDYLWTPHVWMMRCVAGCHRGCAEVVGRHGDPRTIVGLHNR